MGVPRPRRRRLDRRQWQLASERISASLLAILVWTNQIQLWQIYVIAFGLGMVNAVDMPTRQAFVVEMVGREHLMNAIMTHATGTRLAFNSKPDDSADAARRALA